MKPKKDKPDPFNHLRRRAEEVLDKSPQAFQEMAPQDVHKLIHELHVHQIELELQNEELRRTQRELIESRDRYVNLYDSAPVGYVTLSEKGIILKANIPLLDLLETDRARLLRNRLSAYIVPEDQDTFYHHFRTLRDTKEKQTCEIRLKVNRIHPLWVQIESIYIEDSEGTEEQCRSTLTDISQIKRMERNLLTYQKQLQSLVMQLQNVEEEQRRHFAWELHERIGQSLVFVKMKLDALLKTSPPENPARLLAALDEMVAQIITDIQSLTNQISSPTLHILGLPKAIQEWLTEEIEQKQELKVYFQSNQEECPLEKDTRTFLFRAVKELCLNVVKHARAGELIVSLRAKEGVLAITVMDDGIGMNIVDGKEKRKEQGGYGLFAIRERLISLGGRMEIDSEPDQGCRVMLQMPLEDQAASPVDT